MHPSDHIYQLMARALNLEATPDEREELTDLLRQHPSLQQQYELLSRIWQERDQLSYDESEAQASVQKIIHRSEEESEEQKEVIHLYEEALSKRRRRNRWMIAAGLIVLVGLALSWTVWFSSSKEGDLFLKESLIAQKGSRTRSMLPDGTTVWLNAGSKLHFINDFAGKTREVRLDGEAYFDVARKEGKPFIVHTGGIQIKVLGTAFNVKSYPEDKNVETTLFHGRVQVYRQEDTATQDDVIDLQPNQKLILPKQAAAESSKLSSDIQPTRTSNFSRFIIAHIDSTRKEEERFETAWLYSRLEFRGDNFEDLAYKLERWYNVNISFTDEKVKKLNFNGSFEKESISEAFEALQTAVPYFTYKINNNDITVSSSR